MLGLRIHELSNAKFFEDTISRAGRIGKNAKWSTNCKSTGSKATEQSSYDIIANVLGEVLPVAGICLNALAASGLGILPVKQLLNKFGDEDGLSKCTWAAVRVVDTAFPETKETKEGLRATVLAIHLAGKLGDAIISLQLHKSIAFQIFKSDNRTFERTGKFVAHMINMFGSEFSLPPVIGKLFEVSPYLVKLVVFILSQDARIGLAHFTFSDAFRGDRK
jgi:hypothetical protein